MGLAPSDSQVYGLVDEVPYWVSGIFPLLPSVLPGQEDAGRVALAGLQVRVLCATQAVFMILPMLTAHHSLQRTLPSCAPLVTLTPWGEERAAIIPTP